MPALNLTSKSGSGKTGSRNPVQPVYEFTVNPFTSLKVPHSVIHQEKALYEPVQNPEKNRINPNKSGKTPDKSGKSGSNKVSLPTECNRNRLLLGVIQSSLVIEMQCYGQTHLAML